MRQKDGIALGLTALVVGAIASTARSTQAASGPTSGGRPVPPLTARRAFAARSGVSVRSGPNPNAGVLATLGQGSAIRVSAEEDVPGSGFLPIVREWVDGGVRFERPLGWVNSGDIVYTDPGIDRAIRGVGAGDGQPVGDRSDGGECDAFVRMTWPSSVDHFKERLDTVFEATNRTTVDCAALPHADKEEWDNFYATWKRFLGEKTTTFGSGGAWDQTCAYSRTLDGWRRRFAKANCQLVGPVDIRGYELPGGVAESAANVATIVKWSALGLGGAVLAATFYPEIRALLQFSPARRK